MINVNYKISLNSPDLFIWYSVSFFFFQIFEKFLLMKYCIWNLYFGSTWEINKWKSYRSNLKKIQKDKNKSKNLSILTYFLSFINDLLFFLNFFHTPIFFQPLSLRPTIKKKDPKVKKHLKINKQVNFQKLRQTSACFDCITNFKLNLIFLNKIWIKVFLIHVWYVTIDHLQNWET